MVFRLGKLLPQVRGPGFTVIVPGVDKLRKVNMQIVTMPVPAQEGITRDNVTVRVDAVVRAAHRMADTPAALQLRLPQTVMAVAAEKNSTLMLPIPVELLRFLEKGAQAPTEAAGSQRASSVESRAVGEELPPLGQRLDSDPEGSISRQA